MADRTLRIALLADRPDLIPALTDWFVAEWEPYYGAGGPGDAAADLRGCLNRDTLPVALVALDADEMLLGPVDKVGFQAFGKVIQDCLFGGGHGSRFDDG